MNTIQQISEHPVYKEIIQESFGGVLYNVANRDRYDISEIVPLWYSLSPAEKESAGGVMSGAFNFLLEDI